eukprot:5383324-Prymnesium_polylepis.1
MSVSQSSGFARIRLPVPSVLTHGPVVRAGTAFVMMSERIVCTREEAYHSNNYPHTVTDRKGYDNSESS